MRRKNIGHMPEYLSDNPQLLAVLSKLNTKKETKKYDISKLGNINSVSSFTSRKLNTNESIMDLFPEIELAIQIMTSSILSPNDLLTVNSIYKAPTVKLPHQLVNTLLSVTKDYIDDVYQIDNDLIEIVRESLYTKGAYVKAIIPEAIVDEIINYKLYDKASVESIESIILDNTKQSYLEADKAMPAVISLETNNKDVYRKSKLEISTEELSEHLEVTDDLTYLKLEDLKKQAIEKDIYNKIGVSASLESDLDIDKLFKETPEEKQGNTMLMVSDPVTGRARSVGKPLIMKLPVESVVPIHVKGDPKTHLGYFVLLDENGTPITNGNRINLDQISQPQLMKAVGKDKILAKAKANLKGVTAKAPLLSNLEEIYGSLIDEYIKTKLNKGIFKGMADRDDSNDIYRVMFSRVLKGRKTRMLFLPSQLVSYYAFNYRENGTGKSLLETVSVIASMRAILMMVELTSSVKRSTTTTSVEVELDEDDIDPEATKELIISEVLKNRQLELPFGLEKFDDLVDWQHQLGFKFNFKHPSLPDMNITTDYETANIPEIESDLSDKLKDSMIKAFGLTPEMVDSGFEANFAATILANNVLLAKRVMQLQRTFTPQLTDNIKKILKSDTIIKDKLSDLMLSNMKNIKSYLKKVNKDNFETLYATFEKEDGRLADYLVEYFIDKIIVTLPSPEKTQDDNLKDAFEKYKDSLDTFLDVIISEEALPEEVLGELSGKLDAFKGIVMNTLLRKWSADNNYLPDVNNMITYDDEGKPILDVLEDFDQYANNFSELVLKFLKKVTKDVTKINNKIDKLAEEEGKGETPSAGEQDNNL